MPQSYTQEQIDKILEKLPEELQEAIFSVETAEAIRKACENQGVTDERVWHIAESVGYVLMGLFLPTEFKEKLQKELKLPKKTAEEISREINRFVFYPVRPALEQLHKMEIEVSARVVTPQPGEEGEAPTEKPGQEPTGPDTYREPIE